MSSVWLENNKASLHIVNVENANYLVYLTSIGSITPKIVEDVETKSRITYDQVRDDVKDLKNDEVIKHMITKLRK
ncbi:hypothetical protein [Halobacillus salinus]|uniref:Uncharacterized protein n=1 Tax=Halobacillus salinus TaxID=192814 RepID=A0A4Z0H7D7_9BACI|nr:hypothetical protein [Halobacillus salinus]TGB05181.1 hypothetical protein E4663_09375 [Halobacillus salinus]